MTTMCEVMRSVPRWLTFYDTGNVNRRKSVLSLAGFTRDPKSVFKRKRNCFVPFSKICVYKSFLYRFRPSALQHRIRFENVFIPSVRMLKWTRRMRISYIGQRNKRHSWFFVVGCCCGLEFFDIFLLNDAKNSCKATKIENIVFAFP